MLMDSLPKLSVSGFRTNHHSSWALKVLSCSKVLGVEEIMSLKESGKDGSLYVDSFMLAVVGCEVELWHARKFM